MDYCRKVHCLLPVGSLMVLVLKNVTLMSLCLFNDHLIRQCGWIWLLYKLTYLVVNGGMVQQVNHSLLLSFLLPLASPDCLLDAEIQVQPLSPIRLVWSLPDRRLWNAKMKLIVRSSSRKRPIPVVLPYGPWLYLQECPSGCMLHRLLPQVWGPTVSPQESGLPRRSLPSAAWRPSMWPPCLLLSSSSPDTSSLGPMAWFLQLDGPFRTTKENWIRCISATSEASNLMFGMHWGMHRQCPLVMAYRGRTDRNWIIEVTMCCPERIK